MKDTDFERLGWERFGCNGWAIPNHLTLEHVRAIQGAVVQEETKMGDDIDVVVGALEFGAIINEKARLTARVNELLAECTRKEEARRELAEQVAPLTQRVAVLRRECKALTDLLTTSGEALLNTERFHATAVAKGWHECATKPSIGDQLALIHSEVSEALEEYRKPDSDITKDTLRADGKPEGFPSEIADVVIRCFDLAGAVGIDLVAAINRKHAFNETRPYRHGGKRC